MPKSSKNTGLMDKLGRKGVKAYNAHASDETIYDTGGELPDGIEGGIAQLVECKFDVFKKGDFTGEYFFYAAGIVLSPEEHNGVHIKGLRTQIGPEPVCDTPKRKSRPDVEAHLEWVMNELRKLGIDTAEVGPEDLENVASALVEAKPSFRFRTWKGKPTNEYPNPRTNNVWGGLVDSTSTDGQNGVEDNTDNVDYEALADEADSGDTKAADELNDLALEAGLKQSKIDSIKNWAEVVALIRGVEDDETDGDEDDGDEEEDTDEDDADDADDADDDADEEEDADEDEDWTPIKGEIYYYKPPKARKVVEVETTAVFIKKETCNLKNMDTNKVYKAVPWDKLEKGK